MNLEQNRVIAYFQPIFTKKINKPCAYEVLGRYISEQGSIKSLGPFFEAPNVQHEEALKLDRIVRKDAFKKYAEEKRKELLFVNIRMAWLPSAEGASEDLITLQLAREYGIPPGNMVIEITEEEYNGGEKQLQAIMNFKKAGCKIALDDYGKSASNLERLAIVKPDIIKINMDYIHNSEKSLYYREYLRSLAAFADAVGIEVLYEGVENKTQYEFCNTLKVSYYQGFYFAKPQSSMGLAS